MLLLLRFSGGP